MKKKIKKLLIDFILPVYFHYQLLSNGIEFYEHWFDKEFIKIVWNAQKHKLYSKFNLLKSYELNDLLQIIKNEKNEKTI